MFYIFNSLSRHCPILRHCVTISWSPTTTVTSTILQAARALLCSLSSLASESWCASCGTLATLGLMSPRTRCYRSVSGNTSVLDLIYLDCYVYRVHHYHHGKYKQTLSIPQAVVSCSKKRFQFTVQGDAIQILSWMLNSMHLGLKTPKRRTSIINRCFRGTMNISSQKV